MDQLPGKHRFVFDTTSAAGFGSAVAYANNFLTASGGTLVIMHKWDPERALALIERERVTTFGGVPDFPP